MADGENGKLASRSRDRKQNPACRSDLSSKYCTRLKSRVSNTDQVAVENMEEQSSYTTKRFLNLSLFFLLYRG